MNAITHAHQQNQQNALTASDADIRTALKTSLYPGATDSSVDLVLSYCRAAKLDPMQKPVHIVPMWDSKSKAMRDVVMPGIGLYRIMADRSGTYAGISEPEFGPDITKTFKNGAQVTFPDWCRISVRKVVGAHIVEFTAREYWLENYATAGRDSDSPNAMWTKRPRGQIAKCAEAQALRKAFPEVGAQPTAEEMEGKMLDMGDAQVVDSQTAASTRTESVKAKLATRKPTSKPAPEPQPEPTIDPATGEILDAEYADAEYADAEYAMPDASADGWDPEAVAQTIETALLNCGTKAEVAEVCEDPLYQRLDGEPRKRVAAAAKARLKEISQGA